MTGWIVGEYILIPEVRFFANLATNWLQGLYFGIGLAMVALAVRVAPGGWRGMVPRRPARSLDATRAISHR